MARMALGAVFIVAGASKIASPATWRSHSSAIGVPRAIAGAVPWWEVALGAMLAVGVAEPWPAIAAVATLGVFTAVLAALLARGRRPVCACFGALSAGPVGPRSLVRNVALIALGVLAALGVR